MKCSEIKITTIREATAEYQARTPQAVFDFWKAEIAQSAWYDLEKEMMVVLTVSAKHHIKGYNLVTLGLNDCSLCHPREIFRPAIIGAAAAVIMCHNHPSGDPAPSAEDIKITKQVKQAGEIVGIKLLDHVIIGEGKFVSIRESGTVVFS